MLAHALLNCKTAGKFALYYYNHKEVVDGLLGQPLVDYLDEEAMKNLKQILKTNNVVRDLNHRMKRGDYSNIETSVAEKNSIKYIMEQYTKKLENDLMKTTPNETSMPETDSMYTRLGADYYPREDFGFTVIDPATSSVAMG